jgi:thiol-disulfide isomerase/thioredoxin
MCLVLASSAAGSPLGAQDVGLPLGTDAPAVDLEDLDGNPVELGSLIGERPILLEFWASWCSECAKLAPKMDAAYERYGEEVEFIVVAVAVNQSRRRVSRHFEQAQHPFRAVWDGKGEAVRAYKVPTTAVVMLIDKAGKIAYTGVGSDQDLEAALSAVLGT